MKLACWGMAVVVSSVFFRWAWLVVLGMSMMVIGVMFSYRRPQDDPVYQRLLRDGVLDDDDDDSFEWKDAHRMS